MRKITIYANKEHINVSFLSRRLANVLIAIIRGLKEYKKEEEKSDEKLINFLVKKHLQTKGYHCKKTDKEYYKVDLYNDIDIKEASLVYKGVKITQVDHAQYFIIGKTHFVEKFLEEAIKTIDREIV